MTRAAMRRGNALLESGKDSALITLDMEPNLPGLLRHVKAHSELGDLPVVNIYDEIAKNGLDFSSTRPAELGVRIARSDVKQIPGLRVDIGKFHAENQNFRIDTFIDSDDEINRIDYIDRFGNLFLTEELRPITGGSKIFTLYDRHRGDVVLQTNIAGLRLLWFDYLVKNQPCVLLVDSPPVSELLEKYSSPKLIKVLVNHLQHTLPGESPTTGALEPKRTAAFRHASTFDFMVCLTQSQALDLAERVNTSCPLEIIPNVNPSPTPTDLVRDPSLCIVVARMDEKHKRISHILKAFSVAKKINPAMHLEIYGGPLEGFTWNLVQRIMDEYELRGSIKFHGAKGGAATEFARAGMTIMTSAFEGQGMTLVEAMSRGAIPLSYDINYGPRDTIQDGVNGYLIEDGDVESLGKQMALVAEGGAQIEAMRRSALSNSREYAAPKIAGKYEKAIQSAWRRKPILAELSKCKIELVGMNYVKNSPTSVSFELRGPVSLLKKEELILSLRAYDHRSLHHSTIPITIVDKTESSILFSAELSDSMFKGLGEKHIAATVRLKVGEAALDTRPTWWRGWGLTLRKSPSGRVDFR